MTKTNLLTAIAIIVSFGFGWCASGYYIYSQVINFTAHNLSDLPVGKK